MSIPELIVPATKALLEGWHPQVIAEDTKGGKHKALCLALHHTGPHAWLVPSDLDEFDDAVTEMREDNDQQVVSLVSFEFITFDLARRENRDRARFVLDRDFFHVPLDECGFGRPVRNNDERPWFWWRHYGPPVAQFMPDCAPAPGRRLSDGSSMAEALVIAALLDLLAAKQAEEKPCWAAASSSNRTANSPSRVRESNLYRHIRLHFMFHGHTFEYRSLGEEGL